MFILYIKLWIVNIIMHKNNSSEYTIDNMTNDRYIYTDIKKNIEFSDLSYEDIQINLRLLGDLKEGEKLMVSNGKYIHVDQRYIQGIRRYFTDDSRTKSLSFIHHIIYWTKIYCSDAVSAINRNYETQVNMAILINIQKLLGSAQTGLGRLLITYGDDKHNKATIETFISSISTFCDQDLKRAFPTS